MLAVGRQQARRCVRPVLTEHRCSYPETWFSGVARNKQMTVMGGVPGDPPRRDRQPVLIPDISSEMKWTTGFGRQLPIHRMADAANRADVHDPLFGCRNRPFVHTANYGTSWTGFRLSGPGGDEAGPDVRLSRTEPTFRWSDGIIKTCRSFTGCSAPTIDIIGAF